MLVRDEVYRSGMCVGKSVVRVTEKVWRDVPVLKQMGQEFCSVHIGSPVTLTAGISDVNHAVKGGWCLRTPIVTAVVMGRFC